MKKIYILIFINLFYLQTYSQTKPVDVLVGKDEESVRIYFSKLKALFPDNKSVDIEETVDDKGNLILMFETPLDGEEKTGSSFISCLFIRTDAKEEICVIQGVSLTDKCVYTNLKYLKDTYRDGKKPNTWYRVSSTNPEFYLLAEFSKPINDGELNLIKYTLTDKTRIEQ